MYYLNEAGEDYRAKIDAVTASLLSDAVSKAVKGKLTFVIEGGEVVTAPSYDKVSQLLNWLLLMKYWKIAQIYLHYSLYQNI